MVEFRCDLARPASPLAHVWEHTLGSGHAPLGLRADWQAQLRRCHAELGVRHVRFHALLSDQMGTLICQNEQYLYSFFNADQIMDFLVANGMRPFVELSFMPETLASGSQTVFRYRANVTPPRDYAEWSVLIRKLVSHWVERYGVAEVSQWFFEVWNEPNLKAFWPAEQGDYFHLYRATAEAIKGVDGALRVGGPATAQNAWIPEFLEFCERSHLPPDFVSTHYYPTDAFGQIGADTLTQLANAPRDVMRQRAAEARSQAGARPLYYTEWNISSNPRDPLHDEPFAAAYLTHILMSVQALVQGYSFWTFSDIFEENYFPSVPFQGGFGLLNIHGIAKPSYRAYQVLHRLGSELLPVQGQHPTVEAWAVRRRGQAGQGDSVTIILTNHAAPRHDICAEQVRLVLENAPAPAQAYLERIDEDHANPRRLWLDMGQPRYLSPPLVEQLEAASGLQREPCAWQAEAGLRLQADLPPQAMAALTLDWAPGPAAGAGQAERP